MREPKAGVILALPSKSQPEKKATQRNVEPRDEQPQIPDDMCEPLDGAPTELS